MKGTDLKKTPAPDFTLTDQRGAEVRLSKFRGKAVALTFIYTNCPDICPLTAEHIRTAYEGLPAKTRDRVALLAVTVDPERDSTAALQAFSAKHRLADNPAWFALRGDRPTLERVWRAYGVYAGPDPGGGSGTPGSVATLAHTDAVYVIDPKGRERAYLRSVVDPDELASNLKALAG